MDNAIEKNNEAVKSFFEKDFKEAEAGYLEALSKDENNTTVLNNLGMLYHHRKLFSEAVTYYKKAIKINEKDIYHVNLANTFCFQQQYQEAVDHYRYALKLNPINESARVGLAKVFGRIGQHSKAESYWASLIQTTPATKYIVELAQTLIVQSKFQKALQLLYQLNDNDESPKWLLIGIGEFNLKNYGLAETAFKNGLSKNPDDLLIRQYLSSNYLAQGNTDQALQELDFVIRLQPENHVAMTNKGVILLGSGRLNEAKSMLEAALTINSDYAKATRYLKVIKQLIQQKPKSNNLPHP